MVYLSLDRRREVGVNMRSCDWDMTVAISEGVATMRVPVYLGQTLYTMEFLRSIFRQQPTKQDESWKMGMLLDPTFWYHPYLDF